MVYRGILENLIQIQLFARPLTPGKVHLPPAVEPSHPLPRTIPTLNGIDFGLVSLGALYPMLQADMG